MHPVDARDEPELEGRGELTVLVFLYTHPVLRDPNRDSLVLQALTPSNLREYMGDTDWPAGCDFDKATRDVSLIHS